MQLGGVLLDQENLNVKVVSDGRALLDQLNDAPNFYHAIVMGMNLPEIESEECLTFIKRFHERICVLVLSDSVEPDRMEALARMGVRKRYVMAAGSDPKAIASWIEFTLGEEGFS